MLTGSCLNLIGSDIPVTGFGGLVAGVLQFAIVVLSVVSGNSSVSFQSELFGDIQTVQSVLTLKPRADTFLQN